MVITLVVIWISAEEVGGFGLIPLFVIFLLIEILARKFNNIPFERTCQYHLTFQSLQLQKIR